MRRFVVLACVVPAFVGCSSGSDEEETGSGFYEPAGNGVAIGESQACDGLRAAQLDRRMALGCGPVTQAACPGYLQKQKQTPACSQYDQGALDACVTYISGLATCEEVTEKMCIVKPLGNAPNGC
jgi:hypothetical protein